MDARKAQLVNLRFFGGMTLPDVAEYLDCSLRTAEREWMTTRAWLRAELDRCRE
jgi:RNA polymerase sigma-70 factor (ECF subfamily)